MSAIPRDRRDRTLAQQLSAAFVLFGVLVAAAFLATALAYWISWAWLTPQFEESRLAVRAEAAAYTAMIDEENGVRAFLLTHDVEFAEPYRRGELQRTEANKALGSYVDTVSEFAGPMVTTRLAEEMWRERWAKPNSERQTPAVASSMAEGKALFDAYRKDQAEFIKGLRQHRDLLSVREQRLITGRVALELVVFGMLLLLAWRQHRALRAAIVEPVAALLEHIRRVRDGQLQATVDPSGPRELRQLGEGLNEMVSALIAAREAAALRDGALSDHSIRLHQILDASREFSESLNLSYVVGAVRASTLAIGGYDRVIVWLMDDAQKRLVDSEDTTASDSPAMVQGLAGRAAKAGRITFEGPAGQVRFSDLSDMRVRAIAIPLIVGARVVGVLEARHGDAQAATKEVVEVLEMLATHAATAIESARLHEVIEERSQVDALTRLLNRRRLDEDLEAECKRCARYGRPLAFVMLDVDHFKAFNDAHGHPQADTALQEVANVIAGCVRTTDTAYRYGGEEFCVLLRETTAADAMHFAERLRQRIEQRFTSDGLPGITASFGVADFSPDRSAPRALVEAADAAMYESKHAGRNRVALSLRPLFEPELEAAVIVASSE
jgi:diguanylate cyclase (GGDEF)-like protein